MSEPKEVGAKEVGRGRHVPNPSIDEREGTSYTSDLIGMARRLNTPQTALRSGDYAAALRSVAGESVPSAIRSRLDRGGSSGSWEQQIGLSALILIASIRSARARYMNALGDYDRAQGHFGQARSAYQQLMGVNPRRLAMMRIRQDELRLWSTSMDIASIVPETSTNFRNITLNPYQTYTPSGSLSSLVDSEFSRVSGAGRIPSSGGLSLVQGRFLVAKANYYLRLARTFRVRNRALAEEATNLARDILLDVLRRPNNNPEIALSAMLSLGWAYSTRANLAEEMQRGAGREDALRAVAIYRVILYGDNALASESQELRTAAAPIQPLIIANRARVSNISTSLQALRNGTGFRPGSPDACAQVATNEFEINLQLADALALARRYDDSITEYNNLLGLEGNFPSNYPLRDNLFFGRTRAALANALTAQANEVYSQTGNRQEAERILAEALSTSERGFSQLREGMDQETQRHGRDGRGAIILPFVLDQYRQEILKIGDGMAWAYASRGRIRRQEDGDGTRDLQRARRIYMSMHFNSSDPRLRGGSDIAAFINQFTSQLAVNDRRLMRMQTETYITTDGLHHRRGDIQRDLQQYSAAVREYGEVDQNSGMYLRARLARIGANIDQTRFLYTQRHDIEGARRRLQTLLTAVDRIRNNSEYPSSIRFNATLAVQRVRSTLAWLELQAMDRTAANQHLDGAIGILRNISENPDQYNNDSWLEVNETPAHLTFMLAELQRMRGERDQSVLLQADASYERAIQLYRSQGDNRRNQLGIREAQLAKIEGGIARARLLIDAGEIDTAARLLNNSNINSVRTQIREILESGHLRLGYRAINTLTWILGRRGGLEERVNGEGAGRRHFQQAIEVLNSLLEDDFNSTDQTIQAIRTRRETLMDENFLLLAETTRGNLVLNLADLTRAAGVRNREELREAIQIYERAMSSFPTERSHRLAYLNRVNREQAEMGKAEALISIGDLQEEAMEYEEAERTFNQAYEIITDFSNNLQPASDLISSKANLRVLNALGWVISSIGRLNENRAEDSEEAAVLVQPQYYVSLMLYRALLNGDPRLERGTHWRRGYERAEEAAGFDLGELVEFVRRNRNNLRHEEVLFASESHELALQSNYIGSLIAARFYNDAEQEYVEITERLGQDPDGTGVRETEFLANIHSAMGNVYCYRLRDYSRARRAFRAAMENIESYRSRFSEHRRIIEIEQSTHMGFAQAMIKGGRFGAAIEHYEAILESSPLRALAEELSQERPNGTRVRELIGNLTSRDQQLKVLMRTYLGLGTVYTHYRRDSERARRNYNLVRMLVDGLSERAVYRRLAAQAYLGLGDVSQLHRRDYQQALAEYRRGIDQLPTEGRGRETLKLLALLYSASAAAMAHQGQDRQAEELLRRAQDAISQVPEDPYDVAREEYAELVRERYPSVWSTQMEQSSRDSVMSAARLSSVSATVGYRESEYQGNPTESGVTFNVRADFRPHHDLGLWLEYHQGLERSLPRFRAGMLGEFDRMEAGRTHRVGIGLNYDREFNDFGLRITPSLDINTTPYQVWHHRFSQGYQGRLGADEIESNYTNIVANLSSELRYNLRLTPRSSMIFGLGGGFSVLANVGENDMNPDLHAQQVSLDEQIEAVTDPVERNTLEEEREELAGQESSPLVSWYLHPNLRFNLPAQHMQSGNLRTILNPLILGAGLRVGNEEVTASDYGFWSLRDNPTYRAAVTLDFETAFNFGMDAPESDGHQHSQYRLRMPLRISAQLPITSDDSENFSQAWYVRGEVGLDLNFFLGRFLNSSQISFVGEYFNDARIGTSFWSLGARLSANF